MVSGVDREPRSKQNSLRCQEFYALWSWNSLFASQVLKTAFAQTPKPTRHIRSLEPPISLFKHRRQWWSKLNLFSKYFSSQRATGQRDWFEHAGDTGTCFTRFGGGEGHVFFPLGYFDMILVIRLWFTYLSCILDIFGFLPFLDTLAPLISIWSVSLSACQLFDSHKEGVLLYQIASTVSQDIVVTFQLCQS